MRFKSAVSIGGGAELLSILHIDALLRILPQGPVSRERRGGMSASVAIVNFFSLSFFFRSCMFRTALLL